MAIGAVSFASEASAQASSQAPAATEMSAEQRKAREQSLSTEVEKLDAEREALTARLLERGRQIAESEATLNTMEIRLAELAKHEAGRRDTLNERLGKMSSLLAAMQRMGRNPPPVIITERSDALAMVRSAMLLSRLVPGLKTEAEGLKNELNGLLETMAEVEIARNQHAAEADKLKQERISIAADLETKKRLLLERQTELADIRRTADKLKNEVPDTGQLIAELDRVVSDRTGLGKHNERIAEAKAAAPAVAPEQPPAVPPAPEARPSSPPAAAQPVEPGRRYATLMPSSRSTLGADVGRIEPKVPFHKTRAQLPFPAVGRQIISFGDKTRFGSRSQGIAIETRRGGQVTSPCDGWIVYAGEFRSYGQLLIINAGGGYHILLAGLTRIDAQLGQFVLTGEPVGAMANRPGDTEAPALYVEFRKDGRPIDPSPWWNVTNQRAQG